MKNNKDETFYDILGLDEKCTPEDIKKHTENYHLCITPIRTETAKNQQKNSKNIRII